MRHTADRMVLVALLSLSISIGACGQTKEEKQRLIAEHERKAYELVMEGKNEEALREQLKAVELDSNEPGSLLILTGMYMDLKDWPKAVETAKKAVKIAPNNTKTHYQLAAALEGQGDKEGALKSFHEAVRLAPEDANAILNLGTVYEDLGDRLKARENYERALAIDPSYIPALYFLGELEAAEGRMAKAAELFKKAVETKIPENRMPEQSGAQRDAKKSLEELEIQRKP